VVGRLGANLGLDAGATAIRIMVRRIHTILALDAGDAAFHAMDP
jgi:hypothetical protein